MKNKADLQAKRLELENAMKSIVENRAESIDDTALATIDSLKQDMVQIDREIRAIDELRSVAISAGKPVEAKALDAKTELRSAFGGYLRGKVAMKDLEKRAVTVGANGADIVPEDFLRELQETILEYGVLGGSVRHITTADNGELLIPVVDDTANAGAWVGEAGAITKADFATSNITMNAYKLATGIEVSTELLEDSFFNVESYIAKALGERLARTREAAFVNGDGASKPLGILADPKTVSTTSAAAGVVDSTDILTSIYKLDPSQRAGAVIYVSDDLMKDLSLETDTTGRPLLQAQAGATPADPVKNTLGGYPIVVNYELALVAASSESCFIGNPSSYMVRDIRNVTIKRDDYTGMGSDMISFFATQRLDGKTVKANNAFCKIITA